MRASAGVSLCYLLFITVYPMYKKKSSPTNELSGNVAVWWSVSSGVGVGVGGSMIMNKDVYFSVDVSVGVGVGVCVE